jgi:hypothetical protein
VPSIDELAPRTVRERKLDLQLDPKGEAPKAFTPLLVLVSYARALPEGVMLPLIFEVQGPSASSYRRKDYMQFAPTTIIFRPREGGRHLLILREFGHYRWWASLAVDVAGEPIKADPQRS